MIKKTITYTDYEGVERTEDFYFNLSKADLIRMEMGVTGGMEKVIQRMINTEDGKSIMELLEKIILESVGVKSDDGKRFIKNKEISEAFKQTEAYSELIVELVSDANKASEFMNGVIPNALREEVAKHPELMAAYKQ